MVDTSLVTEWLAKADKDLEFGRVNLEERKNFFAQISFHFQQVHGTISGPYRPITSQP